jgi:hypothetical protein
MLVKQIDMFGLEASQAALDSGLDMVGLAVDAAMVHAGISVDVPTGIGGDLHLVAERQEGATISSFVNGA